SCKDKRVARLVHFRHDHGRRNFAIELFHAAVQRLVVGIELLLGSIRYFGDEIAAQPFGLIFRPAIGGNGKHGMQGVQQADLESFVRIQAAIVETEIGDLAFERRTQVFVADLEFGWVGDTAPGRSGLSLRWVAGYGDAAAIDVDLDALGIAGAIVGDDEMAPVFQGHALLGLYFDSALQTNNYVAVLFGAVVECNLVFRTLEHAHARRAIGFEPERDAKGPACAENVRCAERKVRLFIQISGSPGTAIRVG